VFENGSISPNDYRPALEINRPIDDVWPLKVISIGAGISRMLTAIRFPQKLKNIDIVIYEKNNDIGET
jgi:ribulose 1,5-bisphosphate synthetase/thiazole synthase